MNNIVYPDYSNCILNIASSIMSHYGVPVTYPTIPALDQALEGQYKNVVLMVFDGMGSSFLKRHLHESDFLRSHILCDLTSVYPCTTTAAMTSYYSGVSPLEHAWLGWSLYFKEYNRIIDTFTNNDSFTKQSVGDIHAAFATMPYDTVFSKIQAASGGETACFMISPRGIILPDASVGNIRAENAAELFKNAEDLCRMPGRKFIMSYWYEPDYTMHHFGCGSVEAKETIEYFEKLAEAFCEKVQDTIVIASADHGLTDMDGEVFLNTVPEIDECLIMPPSFEPRALSLFVRHDMKDEFKERFNRLFNPDFVLFDKQEVLNMHLLGYGTPHKKTLEFLGDCLACGFGHKMLRYETKNSARREKWIGQHAGLSREEMIVPMIVFEAGKR